MCRKRSADYHLCEKYRRLQGKRGRTGLCAGTAGKTWKTGERIKSICKDKGAGSGRKTENDTAHSGKNLASYDDSGVAGHKSCYVSEAGAYVFHVGNSVRNTKIADVDGKGAYIVKELCVTEALQEALAPTEAFERIRPGQSREDGAISRKRSSAAADHPVTGTD